MSDQQDPVHQVLASYRAAVFAKDVSAFIALYADDLHVFDMWGHWSLRGIDAWRRLVVDWFASLRDERVVVTFDEVELLQHGDLAIGHAFVEYAAIDAEGRPLRSLENRLSIALRKSGGEWKILHEHTSAPIDHASAKAIFKRRG